MEYQRSPGGILLPKSPPAGLLAGDALRVMIEGRGKYTGQIIRSGRTIDEFE